MVCTFPGREPTLLELLAVSGALAQPHHAANRGYEALASPSISRFDDPLTAWGLARFDLSLSRLKFIVRRVHDFVYRECYRFRLGQYHI